MTTRFRSRHPRGFAALFITGVASGFLALLSLQVLTPYYLGPPGLFLILAFDLGLYLAIRRRLRHPPAHQRSLIVWGPVDKRYVTRQEDAREREFLASFLFFVVVIGLYTLGFVVRVEFWWFSKDWPLFVLGAVMTNLAIFFMLAREPWPGIPTESERFDTTKDH